MLLAVITAITILALVHVLVVDVDGDVVVVQHPDQQPEATSSTGTASTANGIL